MCHEETHRRCVQSGKGVFVWGNMNVSRRSSGANHRADVVVLEAMRTVWGGERGVGWVKGYNCHC